MNLMQDESAKAPPLEGLAVLAIDLQPVFLEVVADSNNFFKSCRFLFETVELLGLPLYLTEQVPAKLGHTDDRLLGLAESAPVYAKDSFSALGAPGLADSFSTIGAEHLILAGVETSICVYLTALEALSLGKDVTILSDCVSCRRPSDGDWALRKLAVAGCHVLPLESVFYGIIGGADHPCFREFSKLTRQRDCD